MLKYIRVSASFARGQAFVYVMNSVDDNVCKSQQEAEDRMTTCTGQFDAPAGS